MVESDVPPTDKISCDIVGTQESILFTDSRNARDIHGGMDDDQYPTFPIQNNNMALFMGFAQADRPHHLNGEYMIESTRHPPVVYLQPHEHMK
ncbi:unnamed protein product [Prunus armeniaca]|uniref:Uncharacterized protein n=1 Tax=Prunus armeniaca TaxID=36596 RepID=A0A6J5UMD4_PRUAR|nr:unnamed protein product [Prunus armeniaca]